MTVQTELLSFGGRVGWQLRSNTCRWTTDASIDYCGSGAPTLLTKAAIEHLLATERQLISVLLPDFSQSPKGGFGRRPAWCLWQQTTIRPIRPFESLHSSVSKLLVTCRAVSRSEERQHLYLTNSASTEKPS